MNSLFQIAQGYHLDKLLVHNYVPMYQTLFDDRRSSVQRLLEIGIGTPQHAESVQINCPGYVSGNSLRTWRDYFPNAQIYGVDVAHIDIGNDNVENIHVYRADATVPQEMAYVLAKIDGPLDIVIDDGSHREQDQSRAFQYLEGKLTKDGMYVIEDVQPGSIWRWQKLKVFYNDAYRDYIERKYFITHFDTRLEDRKEDSFCMVFMRKNNGIQ